jgi:heme-degrading monooxygenase HmoA
MIVRQWRGWAQPDRASDYLQHFATQVQAKLSTVPGFRKSLVLTREHGEEREIVAMTFWDRLEDVVGFAGENYEVANVSPEARKLLSRFDERVLHFDIAFESSPITRKPAP